MDIHDKTIGVIGYGNFGKVICDNLFPKNKIFLLSQTHTMNISSKNVVTVNSLEELAKKSDIIIPAVPIRSFEEIIKSLSQCVKPSTVIMDVCSVKQYPVSIMEKYLQNNPIIATHPMFGPNSIKKMDGVVDGLTMVMWNVSADEKAYESVKVYYKNLKLHVLELSPDQHDKLSAHSQFFSLCIGEITQKLHLSPTEIDTPGAHAIFDAMQYMGADRHIIEDMVQYNDYCKTLLDQMIDVLSSLKK